MKRGLLILMLVAILLATWLGKASADEMPPLYIDLFLPSIHGGSDVR